MKNYIILTHLFIFSLICDKIICQTNTATQNDSIGYQGPINEKNSKPFLLELGVSHFIPKNFGGNLKLDYLINKKRNASIGISAIYTGYKTYTKHNPYIGYSTKSNPGYFFSTSIAYTAHFNLNHKRSRLGNHLSWGLGYANWKSSQTSTATDNSWNFTKEIIQQSYTLRFAWGLNCKLGPGDIYFEMPMFYEIPFSTKVTYSDETIANNDAFRLHPPLDKAYFTFNLGYRLNF